MPATAMSASVRCTHCHLRRSRANMSVFGGICNCCYEAYYTICADCAKLTRRHRSSLYFIDGVYCCFDCWEGRQYRSAYWRPTPFDVSLATYEHIHSKRKYGVEVETASCDGYHLLEGVTYFGCKSDPSVSGCEFDSPILYGDEGLDCIEGFLTEATESGWTTNADCGCHTHYDMRDETDEQLFHIAYAYALTYKMWLCCVPAWRGWNQYCHAPYYRRSDIQRACGTKSVSFHIFARAQSRYDYVNLAAYCNYKTFEVRLLEGTIDAIEVCNWITLHCRFIDGVRNLSFQELQDQFDGASNKQFRALVDLIDDAPLTDWLAGRARYKGPRPLRGRGCVEHT